MANFIFNVARGRVVELANRVNDSDPTNAGFVAVGISTTATDATLRDLDTLSAVLGDANTSETDNSGYSRQAVAVTVTVDDTADDVDVTVDATITFGATVSGTGTGFTDIVICYDPDTTGGDDTTLVPLVQSDFAFTPSGGSVAATYTNPLYTAS